MTVTFVCGHTQPIGSTDVALCAVCGEHRVTRVTAPPPKFRGVATGPYCETKGPTHGV